MQYEINCPKNCPLLGNRIVLSEGEPSAPLWLIGEAPGENEELEGRPFVGRAGKVLRSILAELKVSNSEIFVTNSIKCRPPSNRTPTNVELNHCRYLLEQELKQNTPSVIVALGRTAASLFVTMEKDAVGSHCGIVRRATMNGKEVLLIISWHPSYVLRNPQVEHELREDLLLAHRLSKNEITYYDLQPRIRILQTVQELEQLYNRLKVENCSFSLDVETTGLVPNKHLIIGVGFGINNNETCYIPLYERKSSMKRSYLTPFWGASQELTTSYIQDIVELPAKKAAHNASFELKMIKSCLGRMVKNLTCDTKLLAHLLDENLPSDLESLQRRYLRFVEPYKDMISRYVKSEDGRNDDYSFVPTSLLGEYCAKDAWVTYRLVSKLSEELLQHPKLIEFYKRFGIPLCYCLSEMERNGVYLAKDDALRLRHELEAQKQDLKVKIFQRAGHEFNIQSHKDVEALLFDEMKLPSVKATKTGRSVDKDVLKELAESNPICSEILEYRLYDKLMSTYLFDEASPLAYVMDFHGVIHASFNQTGTVTGRLSCDNPNLQNLPKKAGSSIKRLYRVRSLRRVFVIGDYSQMELRMLAWYSQDARLLHASANNIDLHRQVASEIFGVPLEKVTQQQRDIGKTRNFSIVYGQQPRTAEDRRFQEIYFQKYPSILKWKSSVIGFLRKNGYVESCYGRRRRPYGYSCANDGVREAAEREAVNALIQGSSVDFCNFNMVRLGQHLQEHFLEAFVVAQVHDSVIVECDSDDADKVLEDFVRIMEEPVQPVTVKMRIDAEIAETFAGSKK
ncbi:hypothetical protein C4561_01735 [candidate division WWE3 bacterium]|uniref:DNA polymerase I n=1 Tax=candidate division WWE3 bacterium TaxID=2053526 RepID=A0A3A4ZLT0_UNCKA|nr:MAG: hypothetical protein C4561_01735 [candidate division WWE3 bacterium]